MMIPTEDFEEKLSGVDWAQISDDNAILFTEKLQGFDESSHDLMLYNECHKARMLSYVEGITVGVISYILYMIFHWNFILVAISLYSSCVVFHTLKSMLTKKALQFVVNIEKNNVNEFIDKLDQR